MFRARHEHEHKKEDEDDPGRTGQAIEKIHQHLLYVVKGYRSRYFGI